MGIATTIDSNAALNDSFPSAGWGRDVARGTGPTAHVPEKLARTDFSQSKQSLHEDNFSENAPTKERSFFVGILQDLLKTVAKLLSGPMLTDVLKSSLKDKKQTIGEIVYSSFIDSGPSRLLADFLGSLTVRLFNGHTRIFGFRIPKISSEYAGQLGANLTAKLCRAMTSDYNLNAISTRRNEDPEIQAIKKQFHEKFKDSKTLEVLDKMRGTFENNIKPYIDKGLSSMLGIKAGEIIKDQDGNILRDNEGKAVKTNPQINWLKLGLMTIGTFVGSLFLPKNTTSFGFEDILGKSGIRKHLKALKSVLITSLFRLETTLSHNTFGMHTQGHSFDSCFRTSVVEKMLTPTVQYTCDAIGALLSNIIPINGASIAMILRMFSEIPATFLSSGLVAVSEEDRMPATWQYLGVKLWKPVAELIEKLTKPLFLVTSKPFFRMLGFYDPKLPTIPAKDIPIPEELKSMNTENTLLDDLWLLTKETCGKLIFKHVPNTCIESHQDDKEKNKRDAETLNLVERYGISPEGKIKFPEPAVEAANDYEAKVPIAA
jgi:hypothetical protein